MIVGWVVSREDMQVDYCITDEKFEQGSNVETYYLCCAVAIQRVLREYSIAFRIIMIYNYHSHKNPRISLDTRGSLL
jgi:hypothetical protein